jgi:hypothetical protein
MGNLQMADGVVVGTGLGPKVGGWYLGALAREQPVVEVDDATGRTLVGLTSAGWDAVDAALPGMGVRELRPLAVLLHYRGVGKLRKDELVRTLTLG